MLTGHVIFACHKLASETQPRDTQREHNGVSAHSSQNYPNSIIPTSSHQQAVFSSSREGGHAQHHMTQVNSGIGHSDYERVKFVETPSGNNELATAGRIANGAHLPSVQQSLLDQKSFVTPGCPSPSEAGSYAPLAETLRLQTSFPLPPHIHPTHSTHYSNENANNWQQIEKRRPSLPNVLPMAPPNQPLSSTSSSNSPHSAQASAIPSALDGGQNLMRRSASGHSTYQDNWPITASQNWEDGPHSGNSSPAGGIDGQPMASSASSRTPTSSASSVRNPGDFGRSFTSAHPLSAPPNGLSHFPMTNFAGPHPARNQSQSLGVLSNVAMRSVEDVLNAPYEHPNNMSHIQRPYFPISDAHYPQYSPAVPRYEDYGFQPTSAHPASVLARPMIPHLRDPPGTRASGIPPPGVTHCASCGTDSSPEWRKGDTGIKNLCNA